MEAFHRELVQLAPYLSDRVEELKGLEAGKPAVGQSRSLADVVLSRPFVHR
jgi:hypothetical protein